MLFLLSVTSSKTSSSRLVVVVVVEVVILLLLFLYKQVRLMTEILTAIKFIKLYAWENSFARAVAGIPCASDIVHRYTNSIQRLESETSARPPS